MRVCAKAALHGKKHKYLQFGLRTTPLCATAGPNCPPLPHRTPPAGAIQKMLLGLAPNRKDAPLFVRVIFSQLLLLVWMWKQSRCADGWRAKDVRIKIFVQFENGQIFVWENVIENNKFR